MRLRAPSGQVKILSPQGAFHQLHGLLGPRQAEALSPVCLKRVVERVRRVVLGEVGPDGPVSLARSFDGPADDVSGDRREEHRLLRSATGAAGLVPA